LTWRRFLELVRWLPRDSALAVSAQGEAALWTTQEHLTASVIDALNIANWQRGAKKNSRRPEPIPRPGVSDYRKPRGTSMTPEQLDARLGRARRDT
jgi:hypothetical protein